MFTHHDVELTKEGRLFDESQVSAALDALRRYSDVIVISHGWNNDKADARQLYDDLFASASTVLPSKGSLGGRTFGVVRLFWPSKRFAEEQLIPGGGASLARGENDAALLDLLDELKRDPTTLGGQDRDAARAATIDRAKALVDALDEDADARREFVERLRELLDPSDAHPDDASDEFFAADPEELFRRFGQPVIAPPPVGGGGAAELGGAAGLRDLMSGATAAARRIANYVTYYQMKERAGVVGRTGVSSLLRSLREAKRDVPLHLVGHSFGGRLVTAAAAALDPDTPAVSITLLQAAYSHNGLARDFDGRGNDGLFRPLIDDRRASGPIVITHTKNDRAVGIAYPLASRVAFQKASALGDRNDPYGGMGRNGAQATREVDDAEGELQAVGHTYRFRSGRVYNLLADEYISDHGAVTGLEAANALLDAVAAR